MCCKNYVKSVQNPRTPGIYSIENIALISLMFSSTLGNDRYLYNTDHIELVLVQEAILVNVTELPDLTQNLNGKLRVNQHLKIDQGTPVYFSRQHGQYYMITGMMQQHT